MSAPRWQKWVLALAITDILGGWVCLVLGSQAEEAAPSVFPAWIHFTAGASFALVSLYLLKGAADDPRASHLGAVYLLVAQSFAGGFLVSAPAALGQFATTVSRVLAETREQAFLPYFFMLFLREFPRAPVTSTLKMITRTAVTLCLIVSFFIYSLSVIGSLANALGVERLNWTLPMLPSTVTNIYWGTIFILIASAIAGATWKSRLAAPDERARSRLFVTMLAVGCAPICIEIVAETLMPAYDRWIALPERTRMTGFVIYPFLLSVPFTTAYAIGRHSVMDVRPLSTWMIQHAVSRWSVLLLPFACLLVLTGYLVGQRHVPLQDLFSPARLPVVSALTIIGVASLVLRPRLLGAVDRLFFTEPYDATTVLGELPAKLRDASSSTDIGNVLISQIDRAVHIRSGRLMVLDRANGTLEALDKSCPNLLVESPIAVLLGTNPEILCVTDRHAGAALARLPGGQRDWLKDTNAELLIPLLGKDGELIGAIVLGGKRSGLPYSKQDRELVAAVGSSGSIAIEPHLRPPRPPAAGVEGDRPAMSGERVDSAGTGAVECRECHRIFPSSESLCSRCGSAVDAIELPYMLLGKFRLSRKLGEGGMGVVYRAVDIELARTVALKTLPELDATLAVRLRREARAMAALSDPGIATIYGVEMLGKRPVLVVEYLGGGTLQDRLRSGPLSVGETVRIGLSLSDAIGHAHTIGILHRDIKPSNIGFGRGGTVKLVDFGLSRLFEDRRNEASGRDGTRARPEGASDIVAGGSRLFDSLTGSVAVIGTLPYLSPEALAKMPPDPTFDLWSLAVVLYECLTGENPFEGQDTVETTLRIQRAALPDIRDRLPASPPSVAAFFKKALAASTHRRPQCAAEMRSMLESLDT